MHIPDGFLDTKTWLAFDAIAAAGVGYALRRVKAEVDDRKIPAMGVTAAFIFAAQMLNFPVPGGTSGHLLGGVLATVLLGPWVAIPTMTAVLVVQALIFQDGGVTALGANVFNMGIIPALTGSLIRWTVKPEKSRSKFLIVTFVVSWMSVVLAAGLCALQLAASNRIPVFVVLPAMLSYHAFIGIGEGLGTCLVFSFLLRVQPDLLVSSFRAKTWMIRDWLFVGLAVALASMILITPFSSSSPDGLEKVAIEKGFEHYSQQIFHAIIPDYLVPGVSSGWIAASLGAIVGVGVILIITLAVRRVLRERQR